MTINGRTSRFVTLLIHTFIAGGAMTAEAQDPAAPAAGDAARPYLRDRGPGLATSMFGTYVRKGEWLVYPFFEYYRDADFEYAPEELGAVGDQDFRGRYRASEALLFVGYGLTSRLAFELEIATIRATLERSPLDTSALPARLEESGLGDVEGQLRWRWREETDDRPELFSYAEVVVPHNSEKPLTGTAGWEVKTGFGLTRGLSWGTLTARAAIEYASESTSAFDIGEYAVEYLRRLSPRWRIYAGVEGTQDELALIGEAQWHVTPNIFLRFNNGFGVTSKATDWAPEVGIVFSFAPVSP